VFNIGGGKLGGFPIPPGGTTTAPSIFLFATEDGTIVGWNPAINPTGSDPMLAGTFGTIAVDNSGNNFTDPANASGAVYKGLAIAHVDQPIFPNDANTTSVIYVTNFRSGKVEVYDSRFGPVTLPADAFTDPSLPNFYAPFNIVEVGGKLVVTYAV